MARRFWAAHGRASLWLLAGDVQDPSGRRRGVCRDPAARPGGSLGATARKLSELDEVAGSTLPPHDSRRGRADSLCHVSSRRPISRTCCRCSTPCWIRCTSAAATRVINHLRAAVRSSRCRAHSCAAASRTRCIRPWGCRNASRHDKQDYVERALRLANDRPWHAARRAEILAANHAIFQNVAGVRELEQFFSDAVAGALIAATCQPRRPACASRARTCEP